ncbi:MAG: 50S ribosomal protein L10 [Pseudomonadota bacterium]
MKKERKREIVEELRAQLQDALAVVVVDFKGTTVAQMQELRGELRKQSGRIRVVKNTLLRKAIADTGVAVLDQMTGGQILVAWSDTDPALPARVLTKFAKTNSSILVKGGVLSGKLLDADGVTKLSSLPSRDELRAKLLMVFNAAASQFLGVLTAAPRDFLGVLKAREQSLNEAA